MRVDPPVMRRLGLLLVVVLGPSLARADSSPVEPGQLPPEVYLDRTGLPELVIHNTLMGPLFGWSLTNAVFGPDDPVRSESGLELGLGAGIALPFLLTRGRPVP